MATLRRTGFRANFAALFVYFYWLKEFPLLAVANLFLLQCQSKQLIDANMLQNLSSNHEFPLRVFPIGLSRGGGTSITFGGHLDFLCVIFAWKVVCLVMGGLGDVSWAWLFAALF